MGVRDGWEDARVYNKRRGKEIEYENANGEKSDGV